MKTNVKRIFEKQPSNYKTANSVCTKKMKEIHTSKPVTTQDCIMSKLD